MNSGAEAADQMVNMSLKGIEVVAKISGAGAKNLATYLYAVLRDQKKTKGKTRLEGLLRSGKELKVFAVKNEDLQKFSEEAKRYGVLYCVLWDKKNLDGMCDLMVRAEDAAKINRIVERLKLATVDTASIKSEIKKTRAAKNLQKEPVDNPNPMTATTEKSRPSEPISGRSVKAAEGAERSKKSVREELREIKNAQKEQEGKLRGFPVREQPQVGRQNTGRQGRQVKFPKSKPKER